MTPVCSAILTLCLRLLVLLHVCVLGDRGWCTRLSVLALLGTCTSPAQALVVSGANPQSTAAYRRHAPPVLATEPPAADGMPPAREWLLALGAARTPAEEKAELLRSVQQLEPGTRAAYIDAALSELDAVGPLTRAIRWPLHLPSRRATLGSLARLLDLSVGEASPPWMKAGWTRRPGGANEAAEDAQALRRRFLLSVVRQCEREAPKSAWRVEREARKRTAKATSMAEMLRRTPAGLETPAYEVVRSGAEWEVRRYAQFGVVTTDSARPVESDGAALQAPSMPRAGAFQSLAGYLFGGNQEQERLAMTTPVLSLQRDDGGRSMAFVLPSRFWAAADGDAAAADTPPTPLEGSGVLVAESGGGGLLEATDLVAVGWFGGYASDGEVARRKASLAAALADDAEYAPVGSSVDDVAVLQYNDPFTPPWLRRNEVALPCRPRSDS